MLLMQTLGAPGAHFEWLHTLHQLVVRHCRGIVDPSLASAAAPVKECGQEELNLIETKMPSSMG